MLTVARLACGFVFGLGLLVSGMVQTTKVLGFLEVFGAGDPSLAVVTVAALGRLERRFRSLGCAGRPSSPRKAYGRSRPRSTLHS